MLIQQSPDTYRPSLSLQLGQVQATLRSLRPGWAIPCSVGLRGGLLGF